MPSKNKKNGRSSPTVLRDVSLNVTPAPSKTVEVKKEMPEVQVKQEIIDVVSLDGSAHLSVTTRCKREASVLSIDDAESTIDAFFGDQARFTSDKENKLRFWQSLCVEFGLVKLEEPELSVIEEETDDDDDDDSDSERDSDSDCSDESEVELPPLPTSLNKVKALLNEKAHVNLKDYMAARASTSRSRGQTTDQSHLVFPTAKAMIKYTRKHKKFVKIDTVKSEWLNPLLRTFNRR